MSLEKPFEESWFYAPLEAIGDAALLSGEEAFHMRKVLRIKPGRRVIATNGLGTAFVCETRFEDSKIATLTAIETAAEESSPPLLHMVLSLLKGKDLEEPVEALCQLNVRSIHLVTTDHTQEFKGQDHARLLERLRGKSQVALKQAKKLWLTEIHGPLPLLEWKNRSAHLECIVLHPGKDRMPARMEREFAVLSGPEGGFSSHELAWLESEQLYWMGLGNRRLKATHAPILACGKLMGMNLV